MPPLRTDELAAVLRDADPATVAGFLAALEAARGHDVERAGDRALAVDDGGDRERWVVPEAGADHAPEADRVVVAGSDVDPEAVAGEAVTADDVRDALLYAVDRPTAEELLAEWFDRPLASFEGDDGTVAPAPQPAEPRPGTPASGRSEAPPTARGDAEQEGQTAAPADADGRWPPVEPWVAVAVVVLVATVGVGAWTGGALTAGPSDGAAGATPAASTPTSGGTVDSFETPTNRTFATRRKVWGLEPVEEGNRSGRLPPGVNASGDIDESELLAAHEALLRGRSYVVSVTYRESVDGTETALFLQAVRVRNATSRYVETTRLGEFRGTPPWLGPGTGEGGGVGFRASDARWQDDAVTTRDPVLADLLRYLQYYLSVRSSTIVDARTVEGETTWRLRTDGDPWRGVENTSGSVVVTERGLVVHVQRAYDIPGEPVRAEVSLRVTNVGWANETAG